jgi:hypothetical protein
VGAPASAMIWPFGVMQANGPRGGPTGAVRACAVELSDGVYQGGIEAQVEERRIETTALLWFGFLHRGRGATVNCCRQS